MQNHVVLQWDNAKEGGKGRGLPGTQLAVSPRTLFKNYFTFTFGEKITDNKGHH